MAASLNASAVLNGGTLETLRAYDVTVPKALLWMPNVDNSEEKSLLRIKVRNPKLLLISMKRVVE